MTNHIEPAAFEDKSIQNILLQLYLYNFYEFEMIEWGQPIPYRPIYQLPNHQFMVHYRSLQIPPYW